jgi:lysophospholipase L1-like esterase
MWRWLSALCGALTLFAATAAAHESMSYLALGDSYTIGEGVPAEARWPVQLAAALRAQKVALPVPQIIAQTGWTTDELSAAMDTAEASGMLKRGYGFVSLLIGVNNQYRGRDVFNYRAEFTALLERAIGLAKGRADHVLVLSIPDWGATPFGQTSGRDRATIARELDDYNAAAKAICARHKVAFVDITPVSRQLGAKPGMYVDDGLHPSKAMYAAWVKLALPAAKTLLAPL